MKKVTILMLLACFSATGCSPEPKLEVLSTNTAKVIAERCDIPLDNFKFNWTIDELAKVGFGLQTKQLPEPTKFPVVLLDKIEKHSCLMLEGQKLRVRFNIAIQTTKSPPNAQQN